MAGGSGEHSLRVGPAEAGTKLVDIVRARLGVLARAEAGRFLLAGGVHVDGVPAGVDPPVGEPASGGVFAPLDADRRGDVPGRRARRLEPEAVGVIE